MAGRCRLQLWVWLLPGIRNRAPFSEEGVYRALTAPLAASCYVPLWWLKASSQLQASVLQVKHAQLLPPVLNGRAQLVCRVEASGG
jgi:hypothetical protein